MQFSCKGYRLPLAQTSYTCLNNWYRWFLKPNSPYSIYKHLHVFCLADDWKALNYILDFSNFYHQVKYSNQDMFPIKKLSNLWIKLYTFKKNQLRNVICSYTINVPVANTKLFTVFCLGPGLSSTSPYSKTKIALKTTDNRILKER